MYTPGEYVQLRATISGYPSGTLGRVVTSRGDTCEVEVLTTRERLTIMRAALGAATAEDAASISPVPVSPGRAAG